MDTAAIVAIFSGGTLGAVLVAVLNGFILKKKTGAETVELIQRAASGLTTSVTAELERVTANHRADREAWAKERAQWERREAERDEELRLERQEHLNVLALHASWDALVFTAVKDAGIDIPEPPPLRPPPTR